MILSVQGFDVVMFRALCRVMLDNTEGFQQQKRPVKVLRRDLNL